MAALTRSRTWSTVAHPEGPRERRNTLPTSSNSASPPHSHSASISSTSSSISPPSYAAVTASSTITSSTTETAAAAIATSPTATPEKRKTKSPPVHAFTNIHLPPTPPTVSPPQPATSTTTTTASKKKNIPNGSDGSGDSVAAPSFLQPRVAAILGVEKRWQPVLFSLRLLSILPAIILGFPLAIRFLLMLHAFATNDGSNTANGDEVADTGSERLLLTELMLAMIWCGSSGYLSFYFTDYLMSRWLINYTPSATALRLVSISALNGYLQSWTLHLSGSSQDAFLLLPTWVTITSTLTLVYHFTYRKINIRKETSISISVFSMASYISMVALLIQQHWDRTDWLELPFVALFCRILKNGGDVVIRVAKYTNITVTP